jgi:TatD DNase family protein
MVDSHAHLEMDAFDGDRDAVLQRAKAAGVDRILSLALYDEARSYEKAFQLVESRPELLTAVGCHPHEARLFGPDAERTIEELARRERVVALGEVGLDYHYHHSTPESQREAFRRQIRLARRLALPLIIHQREAERDLLAILDEEDAAGVGGVLHSFTSDLATARAAIDRGFFVSFSGILTFKKAEALREVARELPLNRLLVETDCPYLAPVPHRGKRNEPAWVREVTETLARVKALSPRDVEEATAENFNACFRLLH